MALSWGYMGDMANVAQLIGLDAVSLIRMIVKAASTARVHKKNCQQFAHHLKLVGNLLEQLSVSELKKHHSTREPLELLEDALRRSYILVNSCQDCNYLYLLVMGWNIVKQFRSAQVEIAQYLNLIPLITLVDIQRVRKRTENIKRDQHGYTLDEADKKVQDALSNPGRFMAKLGGNTKIAISNKYGLGINDVFLQNFKFKELRSATMDFSSENIIGRGGFGTVYKGWVDNKSLKAANSGPGFLKRKTNGEPGMAAAVKRFDTYTKQGFQEFENEVRFLGSMSHPNVIKLLGYCRKVQKDKNLLVCEYMAHGILRDRLFQKGAAFRPLSWGLRIKIAVGVARGLAFLHNSHVIHRDLKSSNILLDANFNPKLRDFRLAMNGPTERDSYVEANVCGTFGYLAPEYMCNGNNHVDYRDNNTGSSTSHNNSGHLNEKANVFGFGVVLLEMLSGKQPLEMLTGEEYLEGLRETREEYSEDAREMLRREVYSEDVSQTREQSFSSKKILEQPVYERILSFHLSGKQKLVRLMDPVLDGQYVLKAALLAVQLVQSCVTVDPTARPSMEEAVKTLEQIQTMGMSPTKLGPTEVSDPCPFLDDINYSVSRTMAYESAPFDADTELS